jgi:protocatechuate 3,4-dioxygenase beta subunit
MNSIRLIPLFRSCAGTLLVLTFLGPLGRALSQGSPAPRAAASAAAPGASAAAAALSLEDQEREIDKQHLRVIYQAMQAYRQKRGELPNWLSDLVPDFLPDTNVLMSPVELRTGRSVLWGYDDPKVKSSYIYEFNQSKAGGRRDQDIPLTMKQWKMLQMEEFGPVVPLLRCHLHTSVLNVSYSGDLYETALFWESDTNTLALMARLGPGPGARDGKKLRLTVVDAGSGQGIPAAEAIASNRQSEFGPLPPRRFLTDAKGQCEVNLGGQRPKAIRLQITKSGYATAQVQWEEGGIPDEWSASLPKAVMVGGLVKDSQGKPVAGVTVVVSGLGRDAVGQVVSAEYESVQTDPSGKWSSHCVPAGFGNLNFKLSHPEFMPGEYDQATPETATGKVVTKESLLAGTAEMQLQPGTVVEGTVRDEKEQPVAQAQVLLQLTENETTTSRSVETSASGRFRFVVTATGNATLVAEAGGLAPKHLALKPLEGQPALEPVTLTLPKGRAVQGRVVDAEGNPVADASISVSFWNNLGPLKWRTQSDAQGRFAWNSAPTEQTLLQFSKPGFVDIVEELPPSETHDWSVRLDKPFALSGKVVDAETGEPIKSFKLTRGYTSAGNGDDFFQWDPNQTVPGANGAYTVASANLPTGFRVKYMVTADGYFPAASPAYEQRGARVFDFKLKRGTGLSGVLQSPGGEPLAGATVILADKQNGAYMNSEGEFRAGIYQSQRVVTDAQGRFHFQPVLEPYSVMVAHEKGYAEVRADKVAATGIVMLQAWGRVKGVVKVGQPGQTGPSRSVALHNMNYRYGDGERQFPALSLYLTTQINDDGSFAFDKVPPGERKVYLQYKFRDGPGIIPLSHGLTVDVKPGQTTQVTLGGTGRPVIGRIKTIGAAETEVDWRRDVHTLNPNLPPADIDKQAPYSRQFASNAERQKSFEEYQTKSRAYWTSEEGRARQRESTSYVLVFSDDGSFRVDAVPPGSYVLRVAPTEPGEQQFQGKPLGNLQKEIVVPEAPANQRDTPFDLGTLELRITRNASNQER